MMTPELFLYNVVKQFPRLDVGEHAGKQMVAGMIEIGREQDIVARFKIAIDVPSNFPLSIPKVYEIGNALPKTLDRHFMSDDESACLFVPEEKHKYCHSKTSPLGFMRGPVYGFFFAQACFDLTGKWPLGERSHGFEGIVEYYYEAFGLRHPASVLKVLAVLSAQEMKERWPCPCGRGNRIRSCHRDLLLKLRATLPTDRFLNIAAIIRKGIKHQRVHGSVSDEHQKLL